MKEMAQEDAATAAARRETPDRSGALAGLALCALLPAVGTSIANAALPAVAQDFGATFQQVQWVVLAYLLSTTTLVVGAGRLGDMLGRRRLLLAGIVVFMAASLFCALAPTLWLLVAARALQGAGAAVLMALSMALVGEAVPQARSGSAMGLLGTLSAVGTALGPALGGMLIVRFGWQSVFLAQLPVAALALWMAARHLPARQPAAAARNAARFDAAGLLLLALTLAAYALAMTQERGRLGLATISLLLVAVLGACAFAKAQARSAAPLVQLALLRDPVLRVGLATSALVSAVVMATLVVGPFHLAHGLGLGMAQMGLALAVGPSVAALAGVPAGRLVDRHGSPRVAIAGLGAMVAAALLLSTAPVGWDVAGYVLPLALLTAGYALFQAANNTAVMARAGASQRGVVSGLLNLSRNLGLVTGASALGAVFAAAAGPVEHMAAQPGSVAAGARITFAVGATLAAAALLVAATQARPRAAKQ
ncbi:MFS transporter [Pseudorhodoferax sp.]|uniref:MFS transporter n=1 Tax=Pseudorhodoferax sp. TaxID=1993553 RepID=UPI002DD68B4C|nr:MFS transporter [Pseudorhodoferax sp.]